MLHNPGLDGECADAFAGKPTPTGYVSLTDSVYNSTTVGAGLPAMRPSATAKMSGLGQRWQITGQSERLAHKQRLGLG